ncbi:hypothetical protein [Peribacillus sp. SCS-37]|uniref:hypothetical protein n=1 Tax=Paraperibacillus esterisolvens TaxID=3115296 RepID=UPI0039068D98
MSVDRPDKIQKQRKIQNLYRLKRQKIKLNDDIKASRVWVVIIILFILILVLNVLYDM